MDHTQTLWPSGLPVRLVMVIAAAFAGLASGADGPGKLREKLGPGMWYQSDTCQTHGAECPSLAALKKGSGTIQGRVKSPWMRRYRAVVYIKKMARFVCKVHPNIAASAPGKCSKCGADLVPAGFALPPQKPLMDQKSLVFIPHILPVLVGSTVEFDNHDTVLHNIFTPPGSAQRFNLGTYGADVVKTLTFTKLGVSTLLCNVHPDMVAFVVVLQNPYYTVTDKKGDFTIINVPAGAYQLTFWHQKLAPKSMDVNVVAGRTVHVTFQKLKRKRR